MPIEVLQTDITTLRVDAIVTAANESLLGGGGVDGAIHRAAGPALLQACRAIPEVRPHVRCPTGEARLTPGFALPARHVIQTVGPVWEGGDDGEPGLLASCYRNVFALAREHGIGSVALPAISCGVFRFPLREAVAIAVREVRVAQHAQPHRVLFCAFSDEVARAYREALAD